MVKKEEIIIEFKKLGKNKALGLAYKEDKKIILDPRLKGKDFLNVSLHELTHVMFPFLIEEEVDNFANVVSSVLTDLGVIKSESNSNHI